MEGWVLYARPAQGNLMRHPHSSLFGIDAGEYAKAMCSPRVKVGTEYVTKGQTVQQCIYALAALTKGTFGRLFDWLLKVRDQRTVSIGQ